MHNLVELIDAMCALNGVQNQFVVLVHQNRSGVSSVSQSHLQKIICRVSVCLCMGACVCSLNDEKIQWSTFKF